MTTQTTKARKGVPVTKRKRWHRPGDRWEWKGSCFHACDSRRPRWEEDQRGFWFSTTGDARCWFSDGNTHTTTAQRKASLRRIALGGGKGKK